MEMWERKKQEKEFGKSSGSAGWKLVKGTQILRTQTGAACGRLSCQTLEIPRPGALLVSRAPCQVAPATTVRLATAGLLVGIQQASHQRDLLHQSSVFSRSR